MVRQKYNRSDVKREDRRAGWLSYKVFFNYSEEVTLISWSFTVHPR